jgi:hypothetical protein
MRLAHGLAVLSAFVLANISFAQEFSPVIGWEEQLFPSYIISTATMKSVPVEEEVTEEETSVEEDPSAEEDNAVEEPAIEILGKEDGLLGAELVSPGKNVAVKLTITCDEIMEPSTFSGALPEKGVTYQIYPNVKYKFSKLAEFDQATPVSMTFKLQVGKGPATEQTATVMIRPINDCPFMLVYGEDQVQDIGYTFAAYVNEQHPFLDKLLREALDRQIIDGFIGYQGNDDDVLRQVYALWDALVMRDVRYSSITATSVEADMVISQHVRLIEQSINNAQANCVDGSVLFASLLRKVGIEPFLILVPGHCYVGFYADEKKDRFLAIETTMLGSAFEEGEEVPTIDFLDNAVSEDLRDEYSWPSFTAAIVTGSASYAENLAKFEDENEPNYVRIDITEARRMGILPIAFRGKERFEALADYEEEMMEEETTDGAEEEADSEDGSEEEEEE